MEVHCFRELGHIIAEIDADIERLENQKWQAGCIQEASIRHLESANCYDLPIVLSNLDYLGVLLLLKDIHNVKTNGLSK